MPTADVMSRSRRRLRRRQTSSSKRFARACGRRRLRSPKWHWARTPTRKRPCSPMSRAAWPRAVGRSHARPAAAACGPRARTHCPACRRAPPTSWPKCSRSSAPKHMSMPWKCSIAGQRARARTPRWTRSRGCSRWTRATSRRAQAPACAATYGSPARVSCASPRPIRVEAHSCIVSSERAMPPPNGGTSTQPTPSKRRCSRWANTCRSKSRPCASSSPRAEPSR